MDIQLQAASKRVDGRRILDRINLAVKPGHVVLLCGPNGAGKSTLLKALAGLLPLSAGDVRFAGRSITRWGPALRSRVGVLLHESFLYDELSAAENLTFYARLFHVPDAVSRVREMLANVGLRLVAREPAGRLSRGMRQRLAMARTLLHNPDVLLLDEPYAGLDQGWSEWLTDLLDHQSQQGKTVVLIAHEWRPVWPVVDQAAVLVRGRLQFAQEVHSLDEAEFAKVYGAAMTPSTGASRRQVRPVGEPR